MDGPPTQLGHLCLSRRLGERLHLRLPSGELIVIEVAQIHCNDVRLRVDAPRSVIVKRAEIDRPKKARA